MRIIPAWLLLASTVGVLSPVAAQAPMAHDCASPSKLDYLVMASFADSSHWLAMAAYGPRAVDSIPSK